MCGSDSSKRLRGTEKCLIQATHEHLITVTSTNTNVPASSAAAPSKTLLTHSNHCIKMPASSDPPPLTTKTTRGPELSSGSADAIPKHPLGSTGLLVSLLGMGCCPLGHAYGGIDEGTAIATVHEAFRQGINFFDVAPVYGSGGAEQLLGKALSSLPRDQLVIATKVGKYAPGDPVDFSADRVTRSVMESLERLQTSYLDIVYCHDIEFMEDMSLLFQETLPALGRLRDQGLIKALGVTGYPLDIYPYVLDNVPDGLVQVVLSYCHCCLSDTTLLPLLPYLASKGVGVVSASPLSMGMWRSQGPEAWHPAPPPLKEAVARCGSLAHDAGLNITDLAIKYSITSGHPQVSVHLMGMSTPQEVAADVALLKAALGLTPSPAPAPAGADSSTHSSSSDTAPMTETAAAGGAGQDEGGAGEGVDGREGAVLKAVLQELAPDQGTTRPVGLTGNRK